MQKTIDVAATIDAQRIGGFQLRVFLLCAAVLFVDGFDVQGITYVAPAISQDWKLAARRARPHVQRRAVRRHARRDSAGAARGPHRPAARDRLVVHRIRHRHARDGAGVGSLTELLGVRFLTGLGLGGALPNAIGLASEYAPKPRRATVVTFVGSGISLGAIGSGIAAAQLHRAVRLARRVRRRRRAPAAARGRALARLARIAALCRTRAGSTDRSPPPARETHCAALAPGDDVRVVSGDTQGGKTTVADLFKEQRGATTVLLWIAFFMSLLNVYLRDQLAADVADVVGLHRQSKPPS